MIGRNNMTELLPFCDDKRFEIFFAKTLNGYSRQNNNNNNKMVTTTAVTTKETQIEPPPPPPPPPPPNTWRLYVIIMLYVPHFEMLVDWYQYNSRILKMQHPWFVPCGIVRVPWYHFREKRRRKRRRRRSQVEHSIESCCQRYIFSNAEALVELLWQNKTMMIDRLLIIPLTMIVISWLDIYAFPCYNTQYSSL